MLRSNVSPDSKVLNLVRVNAAPLPGFTNWNSTTVYGFPSMSTLRPLRISDVSYMARHVYPAPVGAVKPRSSTGQERDHDEDACCSRRRTCRDDARARY